MTILHLHRTRRPGRTIILPLFAVLAGTVILAPRPAVAQYTFIPIADSSGELGTNFGNPDVNDDGTVAFRGVLDGGGTAIYTGNGGPITPQVATGRGFTQLANAPTINNAGAVAFAALSPGPLGPGIHTVHNGIVALIADTSNSLFFAFDSLPSINDSGAVAFQGTLFVPCCDTAVGVGAGVLYDHSGPLNGFGQGVTINNNGVVAFEASFDGVIGGALFTGSGGAFTTIATFGGGGMFNLIGVPATINDSGAVAFTGTLAGGATGLFIGSGGPIATIVTSDGSFNNIGTQGVGFNNHGDLAFFATFDAGGFGIFTGPDPVADKVIQIGDPLFGSPVFSLNFARGLNNHGDLAFTYVLENASGGAGISGVAVAKAPTAALPADINGDGDVDGADLGLLLIAWGSNNPDADLNGDGVVDGADLGLLLIAWTG